MSRNSKRKLRFWELISQGDYDIVGLDERYAKRRLLMTAPKIGLRVVSSDMDSEVLLASAGNTHVTRDKGDRESKRLRRALWNGMLERFKKGKAYALEKEMYLGVSWRI